MYEGGEIWVYCDHQSERLCFINFITALTHGSIHHRYFLLQPLGGAKHHTPDADGLLDDQVMAEIFSDVTGQKPALIGLMEKFDLICPRLPPTSVSRRCMTSREY